MRGLFFLLNAYIPIVPLDQVLSCCFAGPVISVDCVEQLPGDERSR